MPERSNLRGSMSSTPILSDLLLWAASIFAAACADPLDAGEPHLARRTMCMRSRDICPGPDWWHAGGSASWLRACWTRTLSPQLLHAAGGGMPGARVVASESGAFCTPCQLRTRRRLAVPDCKTEYVCFSRLKSDAVSGAARGGAQVFLKHRTRRRACALEKKNWTSAYRNSGPRIAIAAAELRVCMLAAL